MKLSVLLTIIRAVVVGVLCYMCCNVIEAPVNNGNICGCLVIFAISLIFNVASIIISRASENVSPIALNIVNFFINFVSVAFLFGTGHASCASSVMMVSSITAFVECEEL